MKAMNKAQKKAEIKKYYESRMEFGDIPSFSCEWGTKYFYVCRNNGAFHRGDMSGIGGWATFIKKTTLEDLEKELNIKGATDYVYVEHKDDLLQYMDIRSPNDEVEMALRHNPETKETYIILYPYMQCPFLYADDDILLLYNGSTYIEHFENAIDEIDSKYYINKLIATY